MLGDPDISFKINCYLIFYCFYIKKIWFDQEKFTVTNSTFECIKLMIKIHDFCEFQESVDTPLVERRKNWFQRQLNRMGSSRSSSTAYSSGLFRGGGGGGGGRTRNTSISGNIYSTTNETSPHHLVVPSSHQAHKLSFYDRIMNRKSGRGQLNRAIGRQGLEARGEIPKINFFGAHCIGTTICFEFIPNTARL